MHAVQHSRQSAIWPYSCGLLTTAFQVHLQISLKVLLCCCRFGHSSGSYTKAQPPADARDIAIRHVVLDWHMLDLYKVICRSLHHLQLLCCCTGFSSSEGHANSAAGTSLSLSGDSLSTAADFPPKHPAALPFGSVPLAQTSNGSRPASFSSRPLATQHGFQAGSSVTHAETNGASSSHAHSSAPSQTAIANSTLNSAGSSAPSSTSNGLIGLAMQITASQPQTINSRQQLAIPPHMRPASSHLSHSHASTHLGASPASLNVPAPHAASSLTIAPLNTQPPLHLPATAAQTAASESLLDLWDAADPSGESHCCTGACHRIAVTHAMALPNGSKRCGVCMT